MCCIKYDVNNKKPGEPYDCVKYETCCRLYELKTKYFWQLQGKVRKKYKKIEKKNVQW